MARGVAKSSEHSFQKVGKSGLLRLLCICVESVDRKHGGFQAECFVHNVGTVSGESRLVSDFLRDAFCCLEHGMEIVLLKQFSATKLKDIVVHVALNQSGTQAPGSFLRFRECAGSRNCLEFAVFSQVESAEGQCFV